MVKSFPSPHRSISTTSDNVKQIITAWLHPDITPRIMCRYFLHPHNTLGWLGKPIFHPGDFSIQIQTGAYLTPAEKTWFTKIWSHKLQTNNIQSEYHNIIGRILECLSLTCFFLIFQNLPVFLLYSLLRPKKIICVFPVTSVKKFGSVGRKMFLFW